MEKQEMGELLRLLHAARRSGVLGQIMDTMEVGEQPAGMSDATKRRKNESEEFSSGSEWDATVGQSSGSPAIDNQARYVTEGDTVVGKPMKKEKGGKTSAVAVKAPDTSNVRHVEKSIAVREWQISKYGVKRSLWWTSLQIWIGLSQSSLQLVREMQRLHATSHGSLALMPHLPSKIRRTRRKILVCLPELAAGNPRQRDIKGRPSRSSLDFYGNFW